MSDAMQTTECRKSRLQTFTVKDLLYALNDFVVVGQIKNVLFDILKKRN